MFSGSPLTHGLISFFTSILDVISDLINSLNFLGYNVTSSIFGGSANTTTYEQHIQWGYMSIGMMFLPGIITLPVFLMYLTTPRFRSLGGFIISLMMLPLHPIGLIAAQVLGMISHFDYVRKDFQQLAKILVGSEAFFKSFTKMVFQGYTIIYGYETTFIQIITILTSFILLAKTSIVFDIERFKENTHTQLSFKETVNHTIKSLPCYATTIIFRALSFSLTISFLRFWSIIPIGFLFLELGLLSYIRYRNVNDKYDFFSSVYMSCAANCGVFVASNLSKIPSKFADHHSYGEILEEAVDGNGQKFVRESSTVTYLHHTVVLVAIMVLASVHPHYFESDDYQGLILKPGSCHFLWVFGVTLTMGFYSLILSLYLAKNVINVKWAYLTMDH